MQRGPRERESRYLQFTLQRPGDLIYIPHLLAHAVLTLDTGSPTILSGWDAATTTIQQNIIQTFDKDTFGLRHGKWREIFREKGLSACILSSVNVKPTVVFKLFCDLPNLTWEHVNNIPSRLICTVI